MFCFTVCDRVGSIFFQDEEQGRTLGVLMSLVRKNGYIWTQQQQQQQQQQHTRELYRRETGGATNQPAAK